MNVFSAVYINAQATYPVYLIVVVDMSEAYLVSRNKFPPSIYHPLLDMHSLALFHSLVPRQPNLDRTRQYMTCSSETEKKLPATSD